MPSNHLILCHPLLLWPSIFPSIRVFSNESALRIRWPKYWSFSFSISPSNEYPGLISFRMDWLDLLAVQGTLKSLLQHHSSKASILWHSAFFTVQLSHPYMTTGKTIALTRRTFVVGIYICNSANHRNSDIINWKNSKTKGIHLNRKSSCYMILLTCVWNIISFDICNITWTCKYFKGKCFQNILIRKHFVTVTKWFSINGNPLQHSCLENPMDGGAW